MNYIQPYQNEIWYFNHNLILWGYFGWKFKYVKKKIQLLQILVKAHLGQALANSGPGANLDHFGFFFFFF